MPTSKYTKCDTICVFSLSIRCPAEFVSYMNCVGTTSDPSHSLLRHTSSVFSTPDCHANQASRADRAGAKPTFLYTTRVYSIFNTFEGRVTALSEVAGQMGRLVTQTSYAVLRVYSLSIAF